MQIFQVWIHKTLKQSGSQPSSAKCFGKERTLKACIPLVAGTGYEAFIQRTYCMLTENLLFLLTGGMGWRIADVKKTPMEVERCWQVRAICLFLSGTFSYLSWLQQQTCREERERTVLFPSATSSSFTSLGGRSSAVTFPLANPVLFSWSVFLSLDWYGSRNNYVKSCSL